MYVVFRLGKILLLDRCFHLSPNISSSIILIYTIFIIIITIFTFITLHKSDNDQITYLGFTFVLKRNNHPFPFLLFCYKLETNLDNKFRDLLQK